METVLNEHAQLKDRTIKEDHVPYMKSDLRKQMYKRNTLKKRDLKDRSNPIKWLLYRQQRNNVTGMRRKAIREYFISKCKPGASAKDFWNAIGPFMSKRPKHKEILYLKKVTMSLQIHSELCEIFANLFSTVAISIGHPDQIDVNKSDFLYDTIEKHNSNKAILERHKCDETFEFKQVDIDYV